MGILALIISILKIIVIIVLVILALILLILLVLLFCSIKIESNAKINNEISFTLNVNYLFGIIKYKYNYKNNENSLKIFGKNINNVNKKKKDLKNRYSANEDINEIPKENLKNDDIKLNKEKLEKQIQQEKTFDFDKKDINLNESKIKENKQEIKRKHKTKEKIKKSKKSNDKNISKKGTFLDKLKSIYYYEQKKEVIQYFKKLLIRIIKAIKIKKVNLDFEYGFNDPCLTGKVCGIISIILPIFSKKNIYNIKLMPNFEEQKIIGSGYIKIKTNIFKLLFPVVIFIFKKPIRKIIFRKEV